MEGLQLVQKLDQVLCIDFEDRDCSMKSVMRAGHFQVGFRYGPGQLKSRGRDPGSRRFFDNARDAGGAGVRLAKRTRKSK